MPSPETPRIRVLINGLHARSGGGVTYLRNILSPLAGHPDLELHLLLHADQRDLIGKVDDRVRLHLLNFGHGIAYLLAWEQIRLPVLARQLRIDVTFSPANYGPLFAPRPVILLRNALSVADREPRLTKRLYWFALSVMTLLSLVAARHAAAVSHFALKSLTFGLDRFMRHRLSVVYHGVSSAYAPGPVDTSSPRFLLAVSDIYVQKNLLALIDAFALILRDEPALKLMIAGRKVDCEYVDEITEQIRRHHIGDSVEFLGSVPSADLARLYRSCTIFVFPSTVETFGNPLVEAMACGAPIACSSTTVMPEIVGDCAEFFDPSDSRDLANAVQRLLRDPNRRAGLSARGIARARQFSWSKSAAGMADIFRSCAGRLPSAQSGRS
jgi:glycosyltransferase involved in cell wall biosynthesis